MNMYVYVILTLLIVTFGCSSLPVSMASQNTNQFIQITSTPNSSPNSAIIQSTTIPETTGPAGYTTRILYDDTAHAVFREQFGRDYRVQDGWRFWIADIVLTNPTPGPISLNVSAEFFHIPILDDKGYERDATLYIDPDSSGFRPVLLPESTMHGLIYGEIPTIFSPSSANVASTRDVIIPIDFTSPRNDLTYPLINNAVAPMSILLAQMENALIDVQILEPVVNDRGTVFLNFLVTLENQGGYNLTGSQIYIVAIDGSGKFYGNNTDSHRAIRLVPGETKTFEVTTQATDGYLIGDIQSATDSVQEVLAGVYFQRDASVNTYTFVGTLYANFRQSAVDAPSILNQQASEESFWEREKTEIRARIAKTSEAVIQSMANHDPTSWDEFLTEDAIYTNEMISYTRSEIGSCSGRISMHHVLNVNDLIEDQSQVFDDTHAAIAVRQSYITARFSCGQPNTIAYEGNILTARTETRCYSVEKRDGQWYVSKVYRYDGYTC